MIDLLLRHGVYKNTHYHLIETLKLKKYFDDLLGYNLYDLFPEMKENLQNENIYHFEIYVKKLQKCEYIVKIMCKSVI